MTESELFILHIGYFAATMLCVAGLCGWATRRVEKIDVHSDKEQR